jgi:hypothetical protein
LLNQLKAVLGCFRNPGIGVGRIFLKHGNRRWIIWTAGAAMRPSSVNDLIA